MALLGVDIGSSALKAALYSDTGDMLAGARHEFAPPARDQPGFSAQQLWSGVCAVIGKTTAQVPDAEIRALSLSSHGESFVALDRDGQPLTPFVVNTDPCGGAAAAAFEHEFGKRRIFEITGLPVHPMYTLPKIAWLRDRDPALFARARSFFCVADYLLHRAGVGRYISTSLASRTMGLDLLQGDWAGALLAFAGIDRAALAQPVAAGSALGQASITAARELGIPHRALWVAGGHDQGCCSLGGGGRLDGVAVDGTGTFECLSVSRRQPLLSAPALAFNFPSERHTIPDQFLTLVYIPGGIVLRWFRDTLSGRFVDRAGVSGTDPYALMLADLPDDPTGLFVFPHLIGTGTPWLDPSAQGAIFGLTATTAYPEVAKAVLEGITCEMRWNLDLLRQTGVAVNRIHAVGGGARSAAWLQLKADIFDCPVAAIDGEASCAGAAMCAGRGAGVFASCDEAAAAFIRPGRTYEPRPGHAARYRDKTAAYQDLATRLYGFPRVPAVAAAEPAAARQPLRIGS